MSRFAWVLNLDAEFELARPNFAYVQRRRLGEQLAAHGHAAQQLLGPHDVLVQGASTLPGEFVGRAWCPTPGALRQLRAAGVEPEAHPEAAVLRRVNHRLFAHELGGGLAGQAYFRDLSALKELLKRAERPRLLKRPLAFAGRGQMRFYGPISRQQWSWLESSLLDDGLIVEPLVTPTLELSVHGFVWRDGRFELGRVCVQQVTDRGVFRELRLALPGELEPDEQGQLMHSANTVAERLHEANYFGPFGIDAYRYQSPEQNGFCALSEINARYTMGFVTGFPRHPSLVSPL